MKNPNYLWRALTEFEGLSFCKKTNTRFSIGAIGEIPVLDFTKVFSLVLAEFTFTHAEFQIGLSQLQKYQF